MKIGENLGKQDKVYEYRETETNKIIRPSNFEKCFIECPVINCIMSNESKYKVFTDLYAKISYSNNNNMDRTEDIKALKKG